MADGDGYIYFWYGDDGEWKIFTDEHQDMIERARIQGEDQVNLHRGHITYSLDLINKFQTNLTTNHQRPIAAARANTVWFWKDDDGQSWNCYDREDAKKLTKAEAAREDSVILMIGRTPYYVDLARRTQKNVFTEFGRDICQGRPPRNHADQAEEDDDEDEEMAKAAPESFLCPVALKLMRDPVTNSVGSTYDRKAIEWWWQNHDTDPLTMETISDKYLVPNRALKDAIDQWKRGFKSIGKKPAAINRISSAQSAMSRQSSGQRSGRLSSSGRISNPMQRSVSAPSSAGTNPASRVHFDDTPSTIYATRGASNQSLDESLGPSIVAETQESVMELGEEFYDTLKVVFLGNNKMGTTSVAKKLVRGRNATIQSVDDPDAIPPGVDILSWDPLNIAGSEDVVAGTSSTKRVKFSVWDFAGRDSLQSFRSLLFSSRSLFIIVWDMGVSNPAISRQNEDDCMADDALEKDIYEKVLIWVDFIQERAPDAVIMPVASFSDYLNNDKKTSSGGDMGDKEAKRRCKVLRSKMLLHKRRYSQSTFILGEGDDPVLRVSGYTYTGLDVLKEKIISAAKDPTLFGHIGSQIPPIHLKLRNAINSTKESGYRIVDLSRLRYIVEDDREIFLALNWLSSAGELLYFGSTRDLDQLSQCIILDVHWFVGLAGCMLRHNLEVAVKDTRRLKRKNSRGSTPDIETPYFDGAFIICPLISSGDLYMLWQRSESSFEQHNAANQGLSTLKLFKFLQTLLIQFGVMVPVNDDVGPFASEKIISSAEAFNRKYTESTTNWTQVASPHMYFLPGLLDKGDHGEDLDFYKNADSSMTNLAQSILFFSRVPAGLMERLSVAVLRQITVLHHRQDDPGIKVKLKSFQCWRSIFFLKLRLTVRNSNGEEKVSVIETCAQFVDRPSRRCIGVDHIDDRTKACLVISSKGPAAAFGAFIWNGGFGLVAETARSVVEAHRRLPVEFRGFCTECLARTDLARTYSWTLDKVKSAMRRGETYLHCENGHKVDTCLLLGSGKAALLEAASISADLLPDAKASAMLKEGVVLVGLYDVSKRSNKICKLGSGFVVDSERGLIVTACRNVMRISGEEKFGLNYDGIEGAKIVIGVISDSKSANAPSAVFRYYAAVSATDPAIKDGICHVDACVLQITARFECDVEGNGDACSEEIDIPLRGRPELIKQQGLQQLDLAGPTSLEEPVRILGFEQTEDLSEVNRCLGIIAGYVCQHKSDSSEDEEINKYQYVPKIITMLMCSAKPGLIGGPCINRDGKVIGILSCADPNENTRCFVAPTSEWISLVPPQESQGTPATRQTSKMPGVFRSFSSPATTNSSSTLATTGSS